MTTLAILTLLSFLLKSIKKTAKLSINCFLVTFLTDVTFCHIENYTLLRLESMTSPAILTLKRIVTTHYHKTLPWNKWNIKKIKQNLITHYKKKIKQQYNVLLFLYFIKQYKCQCSVPDCNTNLPYSDRIVWITSEQGLTIRRPSQRQTLRWLSFTGRRWHNFRSQLLHHFLTFQIPNFYWWPKRSTEPVS